MLKDAFKKNEPIVIDIEPDKIKPVKTSVLNMDFFLNNKKDTIIPDTQIATVEDDKKVRKKRTPNPNAIIKADDERQLQQHETNTPYLDTYKESTDLIKGAVYDLGIMQNEIKEDIALIRASKTLKKKYDYITNLTVARGNAISTQISGIKELNKVITDSHNLDMKRVKELKVTEDKRDDDKYIMDMYNAFISVPVGNRAQIGPSIPDMNMLNNNLVRTEIASSNQQQQNMMMGNSNVSPTQNMMRMESNPNIKTVVMYDGATGNRWFDVVDTTTGQSIPNCDVPDAMFLSDINLDFRNAIARDTNLDRTYPLITINHILNEY